MPRQTGSWGGQGGGIAPPSTVGGYISGRKYPVGLWTPGTGGVITLNTLYAFPWYVGPATLFDGMIVQANGSVATSLFRFGVYTDNAGRPDQLLLDAGTVSCATIGEKTAVISETFTGLIWIVGVGQVAAPNLNRTAVTANPLIGAVNVSSGLSTTLSQNPVAGALPAAWGATYTPTGVNAPQIWMRAAP